MAVRELLGRYLRTRRIAWVAALCIAVAVCAMVVITAVMAGFRARIHDQVRGIEPDLTFRLKGPLPRRHFDAVAEELRGEMEPAGGPLVALCPRDQTVGLIATRLDLGAGGGVEWHHDGAVVVGIDYAREREVTSFDRILAAVDVPALRVRTRPGEDPLRGDSAVSGLLAGTGLAIGLGLRVVRGGFAIATDEATVMTGRPVRDERGESRFEPSNRIFRMAGAFESGRDDCDHHWVFIDLPAFRLLRYGPDSDRPDARTVHARVTPEAAEDIERIAETLERSHPALEVRTWKDGSRTLVDALEIENRTMSVVLAFVVLLAVTLVLGLLYMMVVEKTRDIGVLRSMGMPRLRILFLFLAYGAVLGGAGTALGIASGVLLAADLNGVLSATGLHPFSREVNYKFRDIPVVLDASRVLAIAAMTQALALVAGAGAAWKAASLDPVACLRYE